MTHATPFLMFPRPFGAALELYTAVFPDSSVVSSVRDARGDVTQAEFILAGQRFSAYAGGPSFAFSSSFSILVTCDDQSVVDRIWDALIAAGSTPSSCGWITDPMGLSFQIIPRRFIELMADPNPVKVQAVVLAMAGMVKLSVSELERAHRHA